MSFAITGLENANEFYSQHYLDEIVERDLKPLFDRWKEQGAASPVARVRTAGGAAYFRTRERLLAERTRATGLAAPCSFQRSNKGLRSRSTISSR